MGVLGTVGGEEGRIGNGRRVKDEGVGLLTLSCEAMLVTLAYPEGRHN